MAFVLFSHRMQASLLCSTSHGTFLSKCCEKLIVRCGALAPPRREKLKDTVQFWTSKPLYESIGWDPSIGLPPQYRTNILESRYSLDAMLCLRQSTEQDCNNEEPQPQHDTNGCHKYGVVYLLSAKIYHQPLDLLDHQTNQLKPILYNDTITDYGKTRRICLCLPWQDGLNHAIRKIYFWLRISINGHGLLLRQQETNTVMAAVLRRHHS